MMTAMISLPSTPPRATRCHRAPGHFLLRLQRLTRRSHRGGQGSLDGSHDGLNRPCDKVAAVKSGDRRSP
jgi:hypothetical protein